MLLAVVHRTGTGLQLARGALGRVAAPGHACIPEARLPAKAIDRLVTPPHSVRLALVRLIHRDAVWCLKARGLLKVFLLY